MKQLLFTKQNSSGLKVILFVSFLFNLTTPVNSQVEGLYSFINDSVLLKHFKTRSVRSITETVTAYKEPVFQGKIEFDKQGRVVETCLLRGRGFNRVRTEYLRGNLISKTWHYQEEDTSKQTGWLRYVYDNKGRLIKKLNGSMQAGKPEETPLMVATITDGKNVTRTVTGEYLYGSANKTTVLTI